MTAAELAAANATLAPYVVEHEGERFISPDAPASLVAYYGRLRSVGYANGWVK